MDNNFHIFVATIWGEACGCSEASWKAIAHVILNRIDYGHEWKSYHTPLEIIQHTHFDAYTHKNHPYREAYNYLTAGANTVNAEKINRLKSLVWPIYSHQDNDNTHYSVLYYSPKAMNNKKPGWNWPLLKEVSIPGAEQDDFRFFRYKDIARYKFYASRLDGPIAHREVKIKIGKMEKDLQTDEHGELPVIQTTAIGKNIDVFIKNTKGQFVQVYSNKIEGLDLSVNIVRNKFVDKGETQPHHGSSEKFSKRSHTIREGETLSHVAMIYSTSVLALCELNNIEEPNHIRIGQKIQIPESKSVGSGRTEQSVSASAALHQGSSKESASSPTSTQSSTKRRPPNHRYIKVVVPAEIDQQVKKAEKHKEPAKLKKIHRRTDIGSL